MKDLKNADVLEDIKTYPDLFMDIIYTDPPYNLSSTWFIDKDGQYKIKKASKDFLNKWNGLTEVEFDIFFNESFRTLKHGGYLIMYGLDRQLGPFHYYAVKNGFEVCQSLYWFFMSNFPKATDVSKMVDKRFKCEREVVGVKKYADGSSGRKTSKLFSDKLLGGQSMETISTHPIAKKYEGYKYSIAPLKQVLETVMVFHKPLKGKSYIDDIIQSEKDCEVHSSCLNIDGERVEYKDEVLAISKLTNMKGKANYGREGLTNKLDNDYIPNETGRFPSQLLVDEGAASIIDNQTGIKKANPQDDKLFNKSSDNIDIGGGFKTGYSDTGGGSKILHKCVYETDEIDLIKYQPKVSKSERNAGLEGFEKKERDWVNGGGLENDPKWQGSPTANNHPTLKPISLGKHILNLFKTPNHTRIYIPFSGSGSEVIAAIQVGYDEVYACEINEEYCNLAEARVNYWCKDLIYEDKVPLVASKIKIDSKPLPKKKVAPKPKKSKEVDLFEVAKTIIEIEDSEEDFWNS